MWEIKNNKDSKCFKLDIFISQSENGEVRSTQKIDKESQEICKYLNSQGEEQIAFSLLTETIKRELFIQLMLLAQNDKNLIENLNNSDEAKKEEFTRKMQENVINYFYNIAPKIIKNMLPEIIDKFK